MQEGGPGPDVGWGRTGRRPVLGFVGIHAGRRTDRPASQDETVADLFEADGFTVRRTSSYRNRVLRTLDQLVRVLWWRDVDVVVIAVFSWRSFWIADFASAISRRSRHRKVVLFLHGGELPVFAAAHPRWVRRVFDRADRILAPSRFLRDAFDGWGYDIGIVPNVIAFDQHRYAMRTSARPALLWMRAFHRNYGPVMALEVLERVQAKVPEATLLMGGVDYGMLSEARRVAERLGIDHAVRFAGYLDGPARADAFQRCDFFLNTNIVDNTPVSVIEAAACGLVPVANRIGGVPSLLTDGVDSRLVEPGDVDAMAGAILALLADDDAYAHLSVGARSLATTHRWETVRRRWLEELTDLASADHRGRSNASSRTVVQVVDSLRLGGTERMAVDLSNTLADRGWTVHLVVTREGGPLLLDVSPTVVVHQLARSSRWDLRGLWRFRRLAASLRPAVVHTHGWSSLRFVSAASIGSLRPAPVVHHDHGAARYRARSRLFKLVAWPFVRAHLAVASSLLDPPLETRRPAISAVVVNGVPLDRIEPKVDLASSDRPRLVCVGNLREQKDPLGLIRAIGLLRERGRLVSLDLIGATPEPELEQACRQAAERLGPDVVRFLGRVPDVGSRLRTYDLGIVGSRTESGPIALIEYLAAGLPFVTTDVGQVVAELPADLRRWVVPPLDPGALAGRIEDALDLDEAARGEIAAREREVAAGLSMDRVADVVEDVYRRVIAMAQR